MIEFQTLVFYFFSSLSIFAALGVILSSNSVYSALYLVLAFISSACIWLLLRAEFLAIALVLVYVGAVMVLFLFVLMMLDVNVEKLRQNFWKYAPVGLFVAILMVYQIITVIGHDDFLIHFANNASNVTATIADDIGNTRAIGNILYTDYVYPFELAAVLLLIAIVASVALTLRHRSIKGIDASKQVQAKVKDRVRIVSMPVEKAPTLTADDVIDVTEKENT